MRPVAYCKTLKQKDYAKYRKILEGDAKRKRNSLAKRVKEELDDYNSRTLEEKAILDEETRMKLDAQAARKKEMRLQQKMKKTAKSLLPSLMQQEVESKEEKPRREPGGKEEWAANETSRKTEEKQVAVEPNEVKQNR